MTWHLQLLHNLTHVELHERTWCRALHGWCSEISSVPFKGAFFHRALVGTLSSFFLWNVTLVLSRAPVGGPDELCKCLTGGCQKKHDMGRCLLSLSGEDVISGQHRSAEQMLGEFTSFLKGMKIMPGGWAISLSRCPLVLLSTHSPSSGADKLFRSRSGWQIDAPLNYPCA